MGPHKVLAAGHPLCRFVSRSICYGRLLPDWWVSSWNLERWQPLGNCGAILGTVVVSRDIEGTSYEELGWHINLCLLRLFIAPARAHRFASLVVTPRGYKAGGRPYAQPTSYRMISHHLPTPSLHG
jgi:hypothetical protein